MLNASFSFKSRLEKDIEEGKQRASQTRMVKGRKRNIAGRYFKQPDSRF
jgi:hypothetical protein